MSISATSTPAPVQPICHILLAPLIRVTLVIEPVWVAGSKVSAIGVTVASAVTPSTPGTARSTGRRGRPPVRVHTVNAA